MADTSYSDTTTTTQGTSILSAWLNVLNKLAYWGRNPTYGTTTGSANAQVLTLPATSLYSAYAAGDTFTWKAGVSNTSGMTLQIVGASSLAATTVKTPNGSALQVGAVVLGGIYTTVYEATAGIWILLGATEGCILLE